MITSLGEMQQVLEKAGKVICKDCNVIKCMGRGYAALLHVACPHCLDTLVRALSFRTVDPMGKLYPPPLHYELKTVCPFGQKVVLSFRDHSMGDLGYRECMESRKGKVVYGPRE